MDEITRRTPVWIALSEFYLDTGLEETDYDRIMKVLIASEFSLDELKAIDLYEIFPSLQSNLETVIGEWGMFDEEWLIRQCKRNYKKRNRLIHKFFCEHRNKKCYWMRKDCWEQIMKRLNSNESRD